MNVLHSIIFNLIASRGQQQPWELPADTQDRFGQSDSGDALGEQLRDFLHAELDAVEPPSGVFWNVLRAIEATRKGDNSNRGYPGIGAVRGFAQTAYKGLTTYANLAAMLLLILFGISASQALVSWNADGQYSGLYVPTAQVAQAAVARIDTLLSPVPSSVAQEMQMYDRDEFRRSLLPQQTDKPRSRQDQQSERDARGSGF